VHVFEGPRLNYLSIGLESRNHVRNARLRLVKQLWEGHSSFLSTPTDSHLWDLGVVDHVVVPHQDFSILAELVGQENTSFIFFLVFQFKDKVES
jgi:hypothetical protein